MSDTTSPEELKAADKDGDGVIERHEIPDWRFRFSSLFRDKTGAFSSKRIAGFISLGMGMYTTFAQMSIYHLTLWLTFAGLLWGISLKEGFPTIGK